MTTVLFLPAGDAGYRPLGDAGYRLPGDAGYRWWRIADARVAGEGDGVPDGDEPTVAVAPAESVTLHWAELPSRSPAQAVAAARILAAEASAAPAADLHVAIGDEGGGSIGDERPIAVVGADTMRAWLADMAAAGVDPVAIVPAPMLLPRPDHGFVRGEIAGAALLRGRATGFADEARLTELVTAGEAPVMLDRAALETAVIAAIAAPALDLRQGPFARRRRRAVDWALVRRLALLGLAILAVTLAIDLIRIARYAFAADALEARAEVLARTGLPRGETVTDADRQLDERLSRVRGPGLGYSATVAAVYDAIRATPGTELTALDFQANGDLRLGIACEREALATDLKRAIEARGLVARAGVFQAAGGRVTGELTVSAS
ncbi:type II secretion system protein GspL [Sphingomonas sp.]|uniref:type II secretion system protein GspL n=1 Tax=Sphingomonas sp. TaxID=28214 RepID=UPI0035BC18CA